MSLKYKKLQKKSMSPQGHRSSANQIYSLQIKKSVIVMSEHLRNTVLRNTSVLAMNPHFNELCFLESLFIKILTPKLNTGIKASKELLLF